MVSMARLIGFVLTLAAYAPAHAQDLCRVLSGAKIVAQDGAYLGSVTNHFDTDSVLNQYGDYGSKYSDKSIWNRYGDYGGAYADLSPYNRYTTKPPILILNGKPVAYLTVQSLQQTTVHPDALLMCN